MCETPQGAQIQRRCGGSSELVQVTQIGFKRCLKVERLWNNGMLAGRLLQMEGATTEKAAELVWYVS